MKKIFAIIAIVMVACLAVTGLVSTDFNAIADGDPAALTSFDTVTATEPTKTSFDGVTYYSINSVADWKWVFENIETLNNPSVKTSVVIESDLDFSGYSNIPALDYQSVTGKSQPINFSIIGGKVDSVNKTLNGSISTIKGYKIKVNSRNLGFVNIFAGKEISNLKFDNMEMTCDGSTDNVAVGGLVGTLNEGLIQKVSFVNSTINLDKISGAFGGIVGKVIKGNIKQSDFQSNIVATNASKNATNVGGLVGEIMMDLAAKQTISIENSFFKGAITSTTNAGGIIGKIGYLPFNSTVESLAEIKVLTSYAMVTDMTVNDENGAKFGILGNADIEDTAISGAPTEETKIVPIKNVTFTNVISSKTIGGKELEQMPSIFPASQVSGTRLTEEEFKTTVSYTKFDIGNVWIMAQTNDYLDLLYKYNSKEVNVERSPKGTIAELKNKKVSFVDGSPIVMTMQPEDGKHLVSATLVLVDSAKTETIIPLYKAKTGFRAEGDDFFTYYGAMESGIENVTYDYKNSRLSVSVTGNKYVVKANGVEYDLFKEKADGTGNEYTVTFKFDFENEINKYKMSAEPLFENEYTPTFYAGDKTSANKIQIVKIEKTTEGKDKVVPLSASEVVEHKDLMYVFVPDAYNNMKLESVKIKSFVGTQVLASSGTDHGWGHVRKCDLEEDKVVGEGTITEKTPGNLYKIQFNYIQPKPLYDKDEATVQFVFKGNEIDLKANRIVLDYASNNLVHQEILDVKFYDKNDNEVLNPNMYSALKLEFGISEKGKAGHYVFSLEDGTITVDGTDYNYILVDGKKVPVIQVSGTNKYVTKDTINFEPGLEIKVRCSVVYSNSISISGVDVDRPGLQINNIPIFNSDKTVIKGFTNDSSVAKFYYDENGNLTVQAPTGCDFTVNGNEVLFTAANGKNIEVKVVGDSVYTLKSYKFRNSTETDFTFSDAENKVGIIDMIDTTEKDISVFFNVPKFKLTFTPYVKNEAGELEPITEKKETTEGNYGTEKEYFDVEYVNSYKNDYYFLGWAISDVFDGEGNLIIENKPSKRVKFDKDKEVQIILVPKVKITFKTNGNFGTIKQGEKEIVNTFEFKKSDYTELKFTITPNEGKLVSVGNDVVAEGENARFTFEGNTITVALNDITSNYESVKNGKLDIVVNVTYTDITYDFTVTEEQPTEKGGITTVLDANGKKINTKPDASGNNVYPPVVHGKTMLVEAQVNYGYTVKFLVNGAEVTPSQKGNQYVIRIENIKAKTEVKVTYEKSEEETFYNIDKVIEFGHVENGMFVKDGTDFETKLAFMFSIEGTDVSASKVPHGANVTVMIASMNPKYMFYGWQIDGADVTGTGLTCEINDVKNNHTVTLRIVERTFEISVVMPELPYGENATVTVREPNGTTKQIVNTEGTVKVFAKYGESVTFFLNPSDNKSYEIDQWVVSGGASSSTAQSYTFGNIKNDYEIRVQVKKKQSNEAITSSALKIKHDMSYEGTATGYTKAILIDNNTNVILTALPSSDAVFEKWIVKENGVVVEDATIDVTKAEINVGNVEGRSYEAVFKSKTYKISFVNQDVYSPSIKGVDASAVSYGTNVRIEFSVMKGYKIDKVIVNGGEQVIPIGSVTAIDLYNIDNDQTIQVLYHKEEMTDSDKTIIKVAVIMLVVGLVVAVIVRNVLVHSSLKQAMKKKKNKSNNINVE